MEIIIFVLLLPLLIASFITFDKIVKIQHQEFKDAWIADGKPCGYFWKPDDIKWFQYFQLLQRGLAMNRISFLLLFRTPDWAKNNEKTKKLLSRLRLLVLFWNLGMIAWIILAIKNL